MDIQVFYYHRLLMGPWKNPSMSQFSIGIVLVWSGARMMLQDAQTLDDGALGMQGAWARSGVLKILECWRTEEGDTTAAG